ncbi:hypothetical protein [Rhizobium terrae]|nr:hypothetical protein [Rhizobium terrae]
MRETALAMIENGPPEELVLSGLKATERPEYAEKLAERKNAN